MDRVAASEAAGRWFESSRARHLKSYRYAASGVPATGARVQNGVRLAIAYPSFPQTSPICERARDHAPTLEPQPLACDHHVLFIECAPGELGPAGRAADSRRRQDRFSLERENPDA